MRIDADDILLEVVFIGAEIGGIVPIARSLSVADGSLIFFRQILDESVLLTRPQAAGGVARGENKRLYTRGLLVDDISNGLHGTP